MYKESFMEPHKLGLERLTGDNSGRYFCNEGKEEVEDPDTGELKTIYTYDVYEVPDARSRALVKNHIISEDYPQGREVKILRETLAKILKNSKKYSNDDFAEFKSYNEFCESI